MKAGDGSGGPTTSRETWLSAPLSDPNAALWASITPPANPNLATIIRRRAAAFSLDLLAHHLYRRFPAHFSSRANARTAIIAATVAFGAALGIVGYSVLAPPADTGHVAGAAARATSADATAADDTAADDTAAPDDAAHDTAQPNTAGLHPALANAPDRAGETELAAPARAPAATRAADAIEGQLVQPLRSSAVAEAPNAPAAKAKRAATSKKRSAPTSRRASRRRPNTTAD
jgi:hypothetical protein